MRAMQLKTNGIWLYGLAGSGKTFASKCLMQTIQKGFIIDGDDVREFISTDLDYTVDDRKIQLKRRVVYQKFTVIFLVTITKLQKKLLTTLKNTNANIAITNLQLLATEVWLN